VRERMLRAGLAVALTATAAAAAPSTAAAATDCPADRPLTRVSLVTVPVVPDAEIDIEGTTVVTDGAGRAKTRVCKLSSARDITGPEDPIVLPGNRRARFDRVFVRDSGTLVQVAFGMETEVSFAFSGLPTRRIESFTVRSSTDLLPVWLPSSRVLRGPDGLEERRIYYSVDNVLVAGSSVVNRSQVKFYPADRNVVRVPLLAYDVRVEVVDRLFRWPVGSAVKLTGTDAPDVEQPLVNGVASFTEVPRGSYSVVAEAPGLRIDRSLILSRDQLVVMPVLTYVDLLVLIGLPLLIAVGLVLAPRPALRRRIRRGLGRLWPRRWRRSPA
jgi:hypothetical protein